MIFLRAIHWYLHLDLIKYEPRWFGPTDKVVKVRLQGITACDGIDALENLRIIGVTGNSRYQWLNFQLLSSPVSDPDLEIRGGGVIQTRRKGGGRSSKNLFSTLRASVWSKNKAAGPSPGSANGHVCVFNNTGGFVLYCHACCLQDFIRIYYSTNWKSLFIFVVVWDVFLFFILTFSLMFPWCHRFARCSFFDSYCLGLRKIPWNDIIIT